MIDTICYISGVALGIAFAYGWQLTLLTLAFVPFMVLAGTLTMKILTGKVRVGSPKLVNLYFCDCVSY